jgi:hypothetical protein
LCRAVGMGNLTSEGDATACWVSPNSTSPAPPTAEDARDETLRRYAYGIAMPAICVLGVVGNLLNLVVLTRRNMKGTAYTYMRGNRIISLCVFLPHCVILLRMNCDVDDRGVWVLFPLKARGLSLVHSIWSLRSEHQELPNSPIHFRGLMLNKLLPPTNGTCHQQKTHCA